MPGTLTKVSIGQWAGGHWAVPPSTAGTGGLRSTPQLSGVRRGSARAPAGPSSSRHRGHICQRGCREPRCGSGLSLPLGRFTAQPGFITWKMLTLGIFFSPIVS